MCIRKFPLLLVLVTIFFCGFFSSSLIAGKPDRKNTAKFEAGFDKSKLYPTNSDECNIRTRMSYEWAGKASCIDIASDHAEGFLTFFIPGDFRDTTLPVSASADNPYNSGQWDFDIFCADMHNLSGCVLNDPSVAGWFDLSIVVTKKGIEGSFQVFSGWPGWAELAVPVEWVELHVAIGTDESPILFIAADWVVGFQYVWWP